MGSADSQREPTIFATIQNALEKLGECLESVAYQGRGRSTKLNRPHWEMGVLAWGLLCSSQGEYTRLVDKNQAEHTGLVAVMPPKGQEPGLTVLLHRIAWPKGEPTVQVYPSWLCQVAADYFRGPTKRELALAAHAGWLVVITTPHQQLFEVWPGIYTVRLKLGAF
jgi:hypothetical protein